VFEKDWGEGALSRQGGSGGGEGEAPVLSGPALSRLRAVVALYNKGDYERAEHGARALLETLGPTPPVLETLGLVLVAEGRSREAEPYLRKALEAFPRSREIVFALGVAAADRSDWEEASLWFRRVVDLDPDFPGGLFNLARALEERNEIYEAIDGYKRILEKEFNPEAASHYALLLEECNRPEEAKEWVERVLERDSHHVLARFVRAQLALRERRYTEALALLDALESENLASRTAIVVGGRRVRALDALSRYDEAALAADRVHERLKNLPPAGLDDDPYVPEAVETIARYRGLVGGQRLRWPEAPRLPETAFLVGFPRSGTTLLDRMLAAHPNVRVLEEANPWAPFFTVLLRRLASGDHSDILGDEGRKALHRVAGTLHALAPSSGGLLVDKLPLNSIYTGWLARLVPEARFVIAVRDPRDVVLSCWLQAFAPNGAMRQFWDLGAAVDYYGRVMTLLRAWCDEILPQERFLILRYEELVADPARTLEGLCRFLGIDFRAAMLDPRASARGVRLGTPSYDQVSRPLYGEAIGRWRHYRSRLEPYLGALETWVRYWGYAEPS
jgi:tetratricopeptide (TPR) repeat protein